METISAEVKNEIVLTFLRNLERMNILRIIKKSCTSQTKTS